MAQTDSPSIGTDNRSPICFGVRVPDLVLLTVLSCPFYGVTPLSASGQGRALKAAVLALPADADFEPASELLPSAFPFQGKGGVRSTPSKP